MNWVFWETDEYGELRKKQLWWHTGILDLVGGRICDQGDIKWVEVVEANGSLKWKKAMGHIWTNSWNVANMKEILSLAGCIMI